MNKLRKKMKRCQPRKKKFNRGYGSSIITKSALNWLRLKTMIDNMKIIPLGRKVYEQRN